MTQNPLETPLALPVRLVRLLGLLLPLLAASAAAGAQEGAGVGWFELRERDRELGFLPRSDDQALALLEDPEVTLPELRAALTMLGVAGLRAEVPRLESWALNGDTSTAVAALLALGQSGWADLGFLVEQVETAAPELGEAALAALLLTGEPRGADYVERVRSNLNHPLSTQADTLVQWQAADEGGPESRAGRAYYELRYQAARRFGLIGGLAWDVIVLQELLDDEAFLDRVVFDSAGGLRHTGVRDHLFELLRSGPPPGPGDGFRSLRASVRAMPSEVARMVQDTSWRPPSEAAWWVLLDEIDRRRLEGLTHALLREAFLAVPSLETRASALLVRAGLSEGLARLELALDSGDASERALAAAAFGSTGTQRHLNLLSKLRQDPSPQVRAAAAVARFRLGTAEAEAELRERFEPTLIFDPDAAERDPTEDLLVLEELCRLVHEPDVRQLLSSLYPYIGAPARRDVAVALTSAGRPEARLEVRALFEAGLPAGEEGARIVRALAANPTSADLELLRALFPVEDDEELNAALAEILIDRRDAKIVKVLTSALWREPRNRSCLAGALIIEIGGVGALRTELQNPPSGASRRDRFRVGFALGEFGGMGEVDVLAERLPNNDPGLQGAVLGALAARTH